MVVRTTVDIPRPLHDALRQRSAQTGASIRSLIVGAVEEAYRPAKKGRPVTGPLVQGRGKLGPLLERGSDLNEFLFDDSLPA